MSIEQEGAAPAAPRDDAETVARAFHEAYERLAPSFGYETRPESAKPWDEVPANQRALMVATVAEVLRARPAPEAPGELPPLPDAVDELAMEDGFNVIGTQPVYTADQMREYARAAVAAALSAAQEPK